MIFSLAFALGLALPQGSDPATRGPSDAFIAAIDRVCPIYMKHSGLTAADAALLEAEMSMRVGIMGTLRQGPTPHQIVIQGGPNSCLVVGVMDKDSDGSGAATAERTGTVRYWLSTPASGWTPAPTDEQPERYIDTAGERTLLLDDQPDDDGVMVLIEAVTSFFPADADAGTDARWQASARPTDQAILEAIDTVCAIAGTPAWVTIDRGEVTIRHSGNSLLTVDYSSNADCTIRVVGEDAAAVAMALGNRLEVPGSGWTRITHAWMTFSDGGPMGRELQGNYRHDDGREFSIILDEGEAQAILWQPKPRSAP